MYKHKQYLASQYKNYTQESAISRSCSLYKQALLYTRGSEHIQVASETRANSLTSPSSPNPLKRKVRLCAAAASSSSSAVRAASAVAAKECRNVTSGSRWWFSDARQMVENKKKPGCYAVQPVPRPTGRPNIAPQAVRIRSLYLSRAHYKQLE